MNDRVSYFLRRLYLVIPTFIGITLIVFTLCQFVPGGPVEQMLLKMRGAGADGQFASDALSENQKDALKKHFGFDKPIPVRYWKWLVTDRMGMKADSYIYPHKTVWQLIRERFPVSLTFGLTSFLLTYLVCVPLGIAKALRDGKGFDLFSSIVVFVGYAIPAFSLGMLLKMFFSGTVESFWDIFPLGGFRSDDFDQLSFWGQVKDQFSHMFLPVLCYIAADFAMLTLLMKNSLLEQINQDYVRTVVAKGGGMQRAVWRHALRNALIPLATGAGSVLTIMFAGSIIIERVFNIQGMGLLGYDALLSRDYMLFMGILALTSIIGLIGRILSDFCYVLIDPRISFSKE